jgi:hypothetical protein
VEPRTARFGLVARAVLGRDLLPSDGTPEQRIRAAEERLRIALPAAIREYFLAAGEADRLNRAYSILFRPEELRIEQNYLIFMEENQGVVHWGIALSALPHPDRTVWQRVNSDSPSSTRSKWTSVRSSRRICHGKREVRLLEGLSNQRSV